MISNREILVDIQLGKRPPYDCLLQLLQFILKWVHRNASRSGNFDFYLSENDFDFKKKK